MTQLAAQRRLKKPLREVVQLVDSHRESLFGADPVIEVEVGDYRVPTEVWIALTDVQTSAGKTTATLEVRPRRFPNVLPHFQGHLQLEGVDGKETELVLTGEYTTGTGLVKDPDSGRGLAALESLLDEFVARISYPARRHYDHAQFI